MTYQDFITIIKNSTPSDWLSYSDGEYISKKDLNIKIAYHMYSNIYDEKDIDGDYENLLSVSDIGASYGTSLIVLAKAVTVGTEEEYEVIPVGEVDELTKRIAKLVSRS